MIAAWVPYVVGPSRGIERATEIARAAAAKYPQRTHRDVAPERVLWFLFGLVGHRQYQRDSPETAWIHFRRDVARSILGHKQDREWIEALSGGRAREHLADGGNPLLDVHWFSRWPRGKKDKGRTREYRLVGDAYADKDDPSLTATALPRIASLGAFVRMMHERSALLRKMLAEDGVGRELTLVSASRIVLSPKATARVAEIDHVTVKRLLERQSFHASTDDHTWRLYTPVCGLVRTAKPHLRGPRGEQLLHFDWHQHHWWILAFMLKDDGAPPRAIGRLVEHLRATRLYLDFTKSAAFADDGYYSYWRTDQGRLRGVTRQDDHAARRSYSKQRANAMLHRRPESTYKRGRFENWLAAEHAEIAKRIEAKRQRMGDQELSKAIYARERSIRREVYNELARNVRFLLCEHDGAIVRVQDARTLLAVLRGANRRWFGGHAEASFEIAGEGAHFLARDDGWQVNREEDGSVIYHVPMDQLALRAE